MLSLSDNNQAAVIETFNSTSRYLDDLLKTDNPYFQHRGSDISAHVLLNLLSELRKRMPQRV